MDSGDTRRMERGQVDMPNGHWIKDSAFGTIITSLSRDETTIYFERTFDFNCVKTPTSWAFRVTFTQRERGVSCVSVIRRTDGGPRLVNVQFWTRICINPLSCEVSYVRHFISGMASGRVEREIFNEVISEEDLLRLYNQELHVHFFFIVHDCHGAQDIPESCEGKD